MLGLPALLCARRSLIYVFRRNGRGNRFIPVCFVRHRVKLVAHAIGEGELGFTFQVSPTYASVWKIAVGSGLPAPAGCAAPLLL